MTEHTAIPRTRFSTEGLPGPERWGAWCDLFAPIFDIREEGPRDAFRAELDMFELQRMIVARIGFGGALTGRRSRELVQRSGLDHYAIELCLRSEGYQCEGRNGTARIQAGSIVVLDLGQANVSTAANSTSITLNVPREVLDRRCPGVEKLHGTRLEGPGPSGLLRDHMLSLYRHLPAMAAVEADLAAEATITLLSACLAPSMQRLAHAGDIIDSTLLERAKRYIDARLDDPRLAPGAICAAVGISRSNLYRLFQPSGGVLRYVQERRLRRAHAALLDPVESRSITALAYASGFTSAAHFSRAFRSLFGCSPRDARDMTRACVMPARHPHSAATSVESKLKNLRSRVP